MAKSPVTGWRACELEQRAGKSTCIQPPYRHRGGCNSVVVPCRCPIARTCYHEPNCRLQARPSPSCPCLLHQQPFSTNRAQTGSIMLQQLHANCTQKTALAMVRSTRTRKLYESLARKTTCHATRNCALLHQLTIVRQKTRTDNSQSNVCQIPTHKLLCAENTRTRTYIEIVIVSATTAQIVIEYPQMRWLLTRSGAPSASPWRPVFLLTVPPPPLRCRRCRCRRYRCRRCRCRRYRCRRERERA